MKQPLLATAGFLPLHLYENAETARAKKIVAAINSFAMATMGIGDARPDELHGVSLREMLHAVDVVKRYNDKPKMSGVGTAVYFVPDDRLTAAVYALLHYPSGAPDHVICTYKSNRGTHLIAVGVRDEAHLFGEDDDAEEAA